MWATGMILVIIAFPEGTRSRDGRIRPFKKGIFRVALEAGVPIVPVAVEGSGKVLPADGFQPRPGRIRARIGEPIDTRAYSVESRDRLIRDVRDAIIDLHLEIGGAGGDRNDPIAAAAVTSAGPTGDLT